MRLSILYQFKKIQGVSFLVANIVISTIGSCRVFRPISVAARRNIIKSNNKGLGWYTHSTRDVIQKIAIERAQFAPSASVLPLIVYDLDRYRAEDYSEGCYDAADVVVIEICSVKVFENRGVYFQQWCVKRIVENPDQYSDQLVTLAKSTVAKVLSEQQIICDLDEICTRLGKPVIFVNHINHGYRKEDMLPERHVIFEAIQKFCALDNRAIQMNPWDYVIEFGQDKALDGPAHYTMSFGDFFSG